MEEYDKNCVFCNIGLHLIPTNVIYEDDDIMAFLDTNPATYGHSLIISKKHYDTFLSCPKHIMHKMFDLAQRIGQVAIKDLGAKGVNILTNCYESAGQTIRHFHIHVIPRYKAVEGFQISMNGELKDLNLPAIANQIKDELK
ncbi:MAG: HIT domain-containing protein [Firmicutes bacterium]|uniref:HIT domain-containing protein n=1 Tax=Candidatus Onthovivens merdipullorum TaxID=2840889 RepID=A0A9D9DJZ4_9BACL|nr:HIT domain-containing protein [Candidatus Onthovivens merdipullorum]